MKKSTFGVIGVLLVMMLPYVSCTSAAPPAATAAPVDIVYPPHAEDEGVSVVQGLLLEVDASKSTVTVETAQGARDFTVPPDIPLVWDTGYCDLEAVRKAEEDGGEYTCTIVIDDCGEVTDVIFVRIE